MHQYLRSIGFSALKKQKDIDSLLDELQEKYRDFAQSVINEYGELRIEVRAQVARNMGICMTGIRGEDGKIVRQSYYPYIISEDISTKMPVSIYRHVDEEKYSAVVDDSRIGVTLIFRLDNAVDCIELFKAGKLSQNGKALDSYISRLAAFSDDGTVLLPVKKTREEKLPNIIGKKDIQGMASALNGFQGMSDRPPESLRDLTRDALIDAAKGGDQDAMEQLTFNDMNMYAQVTKRLQKEDIYSIVDSVFMPQGVECDVYSVIGDIMDIVSTKNAYTGEELYDLTIESNDMRFHVGINAKDLKGIPEPGRRFKGRIWMMGRIEPVFM